MGIGKPKIISKKKKDPGSIKLTKETPRWGGDEDDDDEY